MTALTTQHNDSSPHVQSHFPSDKTEGEKTNSAPRARGCSKTLTGREGHYPSADDSNPDSSGPHGLPQGTRLHLNN